MGHPERAVNPEETHYYRAPVFHIFPPVLHDWKTLGSIQGALQKKNCSSNFKWLGVIWGLDWLRQICSHCSWFEHELALLMIVVIHLSAWVRARPGLRRSSGSTCESELLKSACRSPCIPLNIPVSPPTADAATTGLESRVSVEGDYNALHRPRRAVRVLRAGRTAQKDIDRGLIFGLVGFNNTVGSHWKHGCKVLGFLKC